MHGIRTRLHFVFLHFQDVVVNGPSDVVVEIPTVDKYNWPKHPLQAAEKDKESAVENNQPAPASADKSHQAAPASADIVQTKTKTIDKVPCQDNKTSIAETDDEVIEDKEPEEGEKEEAATAIGAEEKGEEKGEPSSVNDATEKSSGVPEKSFAPLIVYEDEVQPYYTQHQPSCVADEVLADDDAHGDVMEMANANDKVVETGAVGIGEDDAFPEVQPEEDNDIFAGSSSTPPETPPEPSPEENVVVDKKTNKNKAANKKSESFFARKSLPVSPIAKSTQLGVVPMPKAVEEQILSGSVPGPSVMVRKQTK